MLGVCPEVAERELFEYAIAPLPSYTVIATGVPGVVPVVVQYKTELEISSIVDGLKYPLIVAAALIVIEALPVAPSTGKLSEANPLPVEGNVIGPIVPEKVPLGDDVGGKKP